MKRLIAILCILVLCAPLAACSGGLEAAETAAESTAEETTLTTITTTETTSTSETVTTKRLMYYDILTRIDMITMLLDQADYQRLIDKASDELTAEERVELQYYSCLVFERKQLREYLAKQSEKGDGD